MKFDLPRQSLSVQGWANEHFRKPGRAPPLELDERILIDNARHLLLLLLPFRNLFLQVRYLFRNCVETVTICRPVSDRPDEGGIGVLERLWKGV